MVYMDKHLIKSLICAAFVASVFVGAPIKNVHAQESIEQQIQAEIIKVIKQLIVEIQEQINFLTDQTTEEVDQEDEEENVESDEDVQEEEVYQESSIQTTAEGVVNNNGETVKAKYSISFYVAPISSTMYVPLGASEGTVLGTKGINYIVENSSNVVTGTGSTQSDFSSSASVEDGFYRIEAGSSEEFVLNVSVDTASGVSVGFNRLQAYSIQFNDEPSLSGLKRLRLRPEERYQTGVIKLDI